MVDCDNPGCHRDAAYQEPTADHIESADFHEVCTKHVDPLKDGIKSINA